MSPDHITAALSDISEKLHRIDITLAKLEKEVAWHVRRSDELESQQDKMMAAINQLDKDTTKFKTAVSLAGWAVATLISIAHFFIGRG